MVKVKGLTIKERPIHPESERKNRLPIFLHGKQRSPFSKSGNQNEVTDAQRQLDEGIG